MSDWLKIHTSQLLKIKLVNMTQKMSVIYQKTKSRLQDGRYGIIQRVWKNGRINMHYIFQCLCLRDSFLLLPFCFSLSSNLSTMSTENLLQ